MQSLCSPHAAAAFGRGSRHSAVPAKSRLVAAHNGAQSRSPCRRALGLLAQQGRRHDGVHFVVDVSGVHRSERQCVTHDRVRAYRRAQGRPRARTEGDPCPICQQSAANRAHSRCHPRAGRPAGCNPRTAHLPAVQTKVAYVSGQTGPSNDAPVHDRIDVLAMVEHHIWRSTDYAIDRAPQDNPHLHCTALSTVYRACGHGPTQRCRMPPISIPTISRPCVLTARTVSSDDRECGRSSALFPAMPLQADAASADTPNRICLQKQRVRLAVCMVLRQRPIHRVTVCLWRDRLSGGGGCLGMSRTLSIVFACLSVRQGRGGHSTG